MVFYSLYSTGSPNDRKLPLLKLDGYTLRKVVKQDCEAIHHLVQELANCLNMPDAPQISAKGMLVSYHKQ
ncbi:hypothetical protein DAPPUDRAFT_318326 [Daphnia pulex]|uniref:Uncharacterized protein n=1 Tax=Daphnia pulex TaxID=6669 RepID=E9GIH0_DAPPU|nr:hypothetical protein DAPPUDRAFT_318326 [Daphnia pulex]|eukprot:EFX80767.1 hypothetical protein DAPPUDRAFT_318326 [Daphnia pulex]